jgi:K+-transporting ATPase ATPase C chain
MKATILAIKVVLLMTLLTGLVYPLAMTGLAQLVFPAKANGSLIYKNNKLVGSTLIGQKFDSTIYFWSRPSAIDYNPMPSSGFNLGPTSLKLINLVEERRSFLAQSNSVSDVEELPLEMLFASASGLDPHISPEAALLQADRVALSRNFNENQKIGLYNLIEEHTEDPQFLFLGQSRINVFKLNLALDSIQ